MFNTSEDLATYYDALNLPKSLIAEYQRLLSKWIQCNGIEWTVQRCKTIYTDFVRYRAGLSPVGTWYKRNKLGLPSGILSHIFQLGITSKRKRFSCSVLLRSYTRFISQVPTPVQLDKFLKGVTSEDVPLPRYIEDGVVMASTEVIGKIFALHNQPSFLSYQASPGKRVPLSNGKTAPEETHWFSQWETINNTKTGQYLTQKHPNIFRQVFSGFLRRVDGDAWPPSDTIDSVGKIGLIQEPGFKLRAVANPNRVYQVALKPLGDAIYSILKDMPWDCTFDQSKAIPVIQKHLQQEKTCHCIDLSGATDYFPLTLQLKVLENIFTNSHDYISLFEELSRSDWVFQDTTIKWTRGQPLGLYPSFGSFALTHGLLLYFLNGLSFSNDFFVLGDDVVIMNDSLASKYRQCLSDLGCPISESKSLSSVAMAEFGGKLIFRDFSEPQLKWRQLSDDNFVDIVRLLGMRSLRLLRPQQRVVVKAIWDIPDFVGGIGFNPKGIPLQDRYQKYLELFGDDCSTFLMSYDRQFKEFFMNSVKSTSNREYSQEWDGSKLPDLDQRSAALVLKHMPTLARWYGLLGTNLFSVSPEKGVLPIDGITGKRQTLLALLQRKLGM